MSLKQIIKENINDKENMAKAYSCIGTIEKISQNGKIASIKAFIPTLKEHMLISNATLLSNPCMSSPYEVGDSVYVTFDGNNLAGCKVIGTIKGKDTGNHFRTNIIATIQSDKNLRKENTSERESILSLSEGKFGKLDIDEINGFLDIYESKLEGFSEQEVGLTSKYNDSAIKTLNNGDILIGAGLTYILIKKDGRIIIRGEVSYQ